MYLNIGAILTVGYATKGRLWEWIPASFEKLEEAEKRILQKHVRTPFEIKKIASLGTVVVPCSDQNKQKTAKNLVLIHGFAGGNAMWAANLEHLAKDFNVVRVMILTDKWSSIDIVAKFFLVCG
jgi:pimeloyl-ACP methyl ester carboxylesterase